MIEARNLSKTYPTAAQPALRDVSLQVPAGSRFGILGPNGAGKSTLLSILLGLLPKDGGELRVADTDVDQDPAAIRRLFGMVPQEPSFYPTLTPAENLAFYAAVRGYRRHMRDRELARVVAIAGLEAYLNIRADRLSGGLKRRLNLAIGLLGAPRILCLDEPTVGVDPHSRYFILDSVRRLADESGVTVLYASHYMSEVESLCDHVAILDGGTVLRAGPLAELLSGGGGRIHLYCDRAVPETALEHLPEAFQARREGSSTLSLLSDDPGAALPALAAWLQRHELQLEGLQYGREDLQSLFLRLTGRHLRDH